MQLKNIISTIIIKLAIAMVRLVGASAIVQKHTGWRTSDRYYALKGRLTTVTVVHKSLGSVSDSATYTDIVRARNNM